MGAWIIGLDVGGTKIAGGLVDSSDGRVITRTRIPTMPERGGDAILDDAVALAETLRDEAVTRGGSVRAVGIGIAELVDAEGAVTSFHTIGWRGLPVKERFAAVAPATVESDVRAAALAEARYGAGREFPIFAYVTIGTGISCCLVQGGVPYAGARGAALVLASAPLSIPCAHCGKTTDLVLEEYAAGPALAARYARLSGRPIGRAEDVFSAATAGDADAVEILRSAGAALGSAVGWLVNVLDPLAVVVGGGLGLAGGGYWDALVSATRAHVWHDAARGLPILTAALRADAGVVGAAAVADGGIGGPDLEQNQPRPKPR